MNYTAKQMQYIDSVGGEAHITAVEIIGELETELAMARDLFRHTNLKLGLVVGISPEADRRIDDIAGAIEYFLTGARNGRLRNDETNDR